MRISTIGYSMKQGVKNIGRNKLFSIASIATMAACIFLFGLFYSIVVNFNYIVEKAEEGVAITVFLKRMPQMNRKKRSAHSWRRQTECWKSTMSALMMHGASSRRNNFGDNAELAEGFQTDNPLANSDNYEVYMSDVSKQSDVVKICRESGRSQERKPLGCGGKDSDKRKPSGRICIHCDHRHLAGGINLPDQQHCYYGYYSSAGGDCDHEIYRGEGQFCPGAVRDRRSSNRCCWCGDPSGAAVLYV